MRSAETILNLLALHSLVIASLVLFAIPLSVVFRRCDVHLRYWIAVVILFKCLAFPMVEISSDSSFLARYATIHVPEPKSALSSLQKRNASHNSRSGPTSSSSLLEAPHALGFEFLPAVVRSSVVWLTVWLIGVLAYSGWLILHAVKVQLFLCRHRSEPNLEVELGFSSLLQSSNIGFRPRLRMIAGIHQPFVWGTWTGAIYLPEAFGDSGNHGHRRIILAHELGHVIRRDAFVNLIQMTAQALFWFHPAIWWLNGFIRREREKCCDEFAISLTQSSVKDYANSVLDHLVQSGTPITAWSSLAVSGNARSLQSRIWSIMDSNKMIRSSIMWPGALAVGIIAMLSCPLQVRWSNAPDVKAKPGPYECLELFHPTSGRTDYLDRLETALPKGRLEFESVPFQFNGAVRPLRLFGGGGRDEIATLKLQRPIKELHVLHGVYGDADDATQIADIRIRFKNGDEETFPIVYGVHARSFEFWDYAPVRDTATKMVWVGRDEKSKNSQSALRLYYTPWKNPRPERIVESMAYFTTQSICEPFLVAVTIQ